MTEDKKNKIDLEFITPFLKGLKSAIEVQCKTSIKPMDPYIKQAPNNDVVIASTLSLQDNDFKGMVILSFPESVFLSVYNNMFNEQHSKITKDIEDAAAELLNMIYGSAKTELNQKGYNFPTAFPKVITQIDLDNYQKNYTQTVVSPFLTDKGLLYLEINFNN